MSTPATTQRYPIVGLKDLAAESVALGCDLAALAGRRDDVELAAASGRALEIGRYLTNVAVALHDMTGWGCEP